MHIVIAEATIDPSQREAMLALGKPMIEASRAKPGCLGYSDSFDLLSPTTMRITELGRDEAALKSHFTTPHRAAFQAGLGKLSVSNLVLKSYLVDREIPFPC